MTSHIWFDDHHLPNEEFKCHLDEELMKYPNEQFQLEKHENKYSDCIFNTKTLVPSCDKL